MPPPKDVISSVCVYCASSDGDDPAWIEAAARLGAALAAADIRLIYGGGGVGLMGACAGAAQAAGGQVLGVMPRFLISRERLLPDIETVVVETMHERKIRMFDEADGFVVLPGAIGTLEEAIELISWRRLGLHAKPIVFYNPAGFWAPLFDLFDHFIAAKLVPREFSECWRVVENIQDVIPALLAMPLNPATLPLHMGDVA